MSLTYDYKVGLKKQIIEALKAIWLHQPDSRYNGIYIGLEYPLEQIRYPAIYINYQEGPLRNVGVGHLETQEDDNFVTSQVRHYMFNGTLNFNVLALNPLDRDNLTAVLMNLLALGRNMPEFIDFYNRAENDKYLLVQLNTEVITPSGEQTGTAPWDNPDTIVYGNRYSVPLIGEFYSDPWTGELVEISAVELYPYEEGTPAPW
jgi:hypothetical protein